MQSEYSGEWEHINPELSRVETHSGWIVLTRTHMIVGGKDAWVVNNSFPLSDPEKKWRIKTK
jgi:hypothetical protein